MTVLVTGLDQAVGRYILDVGRSEGRKMRVLARPDSVASLPDRSGFEHVAGTLDDDAALAAAVRGVDIVFHTATLMQGTAPELQRINAGGTRRLLEACAGDIRRFVLISTPSVYESHPTPDTWPVRADARREAHGPPQFQAYGQSMIDAEDYILEASRLYGMEYCLLRMATVWERSGYPSGVTNALMRRPEMAEQMDRMLGPIQWLHGLDAARAAFLAAEEPAARNQAFIVAGAEGMTSFGLLALLSDVTRPNEANPFTAQATAHRLAVPKLDISKIKDVLGFVPEIGMRQSVEEVLGMTELSATARTAAPATSEGAEPDMHGKTCVITGATSGIGLATAERLAALGARLVLVGRNPARGEAALRQIKAKTPAAEISIHYADLSLVSEIRRLADEILQAEPRIDVLINNAGAIFDGREVTAEGLERTFAVNHMAPFVLTALLRDRLVQSAPARVITLTSRAHRNATVEFDDLQNERVSNGYAAYQRAKLCNLLFTRELAHRLAGTGVAAFALEPGPTASNIGDTVTGPLGAFLARAKQNSSFPPEKAAGFVVYLAGSPAVAEANGGYFDQGQGAAPAPAASDDRTARRLWDESARLAGLPA